MSTNGRASYTHDVGAAAPDVGGSPRRSGSIHHRLKTTAFRLRWPWTPDRRQGRHLSWQLPTSLIGAKIMARRKISDTALVVLVAMIGGPIWLFQNYPVLAVVLGAIFISGFIQYSRCRVCEVCGVVLKRVVYLWEINGQSKRVCPICNRTLERRQSNRALRNL
jgi:hypothetical protein